MKYIIIAFAFFALNLPLVNAYRDVNPSSDLLPIIDHFKKKGVLDGKGFFRSESAAPKIMFFSFLLHEVPKEELEEDFVVPKRLDTNPHRDILIKAIQQELITSFEDDILSPIKKGEAIKQIVKIKEYKKERLASKSFQRKVSGVSPLSPYLPLLESAYNEGILKQRDLNPFDQEDSLKRRELIQWFYRIGPSKDTSNIDPKINLPYQKRKASSEIKVRLLNNDSKKKASKTKESLEKQILEEVINQVRQKFKFIDYTKEEEVAELFHKTTESFVNSLDDKYSNYIRPRKSKSFLEDLGGTFEGIGVYVEMIGNNFTIVSPLKGSPGEFAGLLPGDIIEAVDGQDVKSLSSKEIVSKIRGVRGTLVRLKVKRTDGSMRHFDIIRDKITIPAVTLEFKNSIAVVDVQRFSNGLAEKIEQIIRDEVLPKQPRGIVFDFRFNPGGFLTEATKIGSLFLDRGETVFSIEYKNKTRVYKSQKKGILSDFPHLVFLQNKGTASASEIITAMIKDYEKGTIIGTPSTGKGSVQEVINYKNGGVLKLTVAKWLSPLGRSINEVGVIPDIEIADQTQEERNNEIDRQLDAAVEKALRP